MPLSIILVGGGIAGLTSAVALTKAGHSVQVFEKSSFAAEVGAAVSIAPNGARVLARLGFSFERARAVPLRTWETRDAATLEVIDSVVPTAEQYGHPFMSVHRVDFHNELLRLANAAGGDRIPRVSSRVVAVDPHAGSVTLANGDTHSADLIVAADGVHSTLRSLLVTDPADAPRRSLTSMRFLFNTDDLLAIDGVKDIYDLKASFASGFFDSTSKPGKSRHFVWYACRGGEVQNFNALVSTYDGPMLEDPAECKALLLREFGAVHPTLSRVLHAAEGVKMWPLIQRPALSHWVYGKVLLIGDAAHPMLPMGGQGANQSIEDGGALGLVLAGVEPDQLMQRLEVFERVRLRRATRVQILSSVLPGREADVTERLRPQLEPGVKEIPTTLASHIHHDFSSVRPLELIPDRVLIFAQL